MNNRLSLSTRSGSSPALLALIALGLLLLGLGSGAPQVTAQAAPSSNSRASSQGSVGDTELHWAAYRGHAGVVERLLKAGSRVDQRVNKGSTPLHLAAYKGHHQVVSLLIDYGANVNAKNVEGITPLDWARSNEHEKTEALLLSKGAVVGKPLPVKSKSRSSIASPAAASPGQYLLSRSGQYREQPLRRVPPAPVEEDFVEQPIRQEELDKLESVSQINQMMAKYRDEEAVQSMDAVDDPGPGEAVADTPEEVTLEADGQGDGEIDSEVEIELSEEPIPAAQPQQQHALPQVEPSSEGYRVQLVALGSSERAEIVRAEYAQRFGNELGDASLVVEPLTTASRVLYRLRSSALSSAEAARVCEQLKRRSQPCIVVSPSN